MLRRGTTLRFDVISVNISSAAILFGCQSFMEASAMEIDGVEHQSDIRSTSFAVPSCQCVVAFVGRVHFVESVRRDIRPRSMILRDIHTLLSSSRCLQQPFGESAAAAAASLVDGARSPVITEITRVTSQLRYKSVFWLVFVTDDRTVLFLVDSSSSF